MTFSKPAISPANCVTNTSVMTITESNTCVNFYEVIVYKLKLDSWWYSFSEISLQLGIGVGVGTAALLLILGMVAVWEWAVKALAKKREEKARRLQKKASLARSLTPRTRTPSVFTWDSERDSFRKLSYASYNSATLSPLPVERSDRKFSYASTTLSPLPLERDCNRKLSYVSYNSTTLSPLPVERYWNWLLLSGQYSNKPASRRRETFLLAMISVHRWTLSHLE